MAVAARGKATELQIPKKWRDRSECSPERTIVWTEPKANKTSEKRSVPVVYYLSRNGQLEHPHFIEVPLSSPEGLYLGGKIQKTLYKNYSSFFFFKTTCLLFGCRESSCKGFFFFAFSWAEVPCFFSVCFSLELVKAFTQCLAAENTWRKKERKKIMEKISVFTIPIFLLFLGNQIGLIVIHSDESVSFECSFQIF